MIIPFLSITILNSIAPPLQSSLCMDGMKLWQGSKDLSLGGADILQVYLKLW